MDSTAADIDLFVGLDTNGNGPELSEELCQSTAGGYIEHCSFGDPTAGTYWVLAQNWTASGSPPDSITLATLPTSSQARFSWMTSGRPSQV